MTINKGILLGFVPSGDTLVCNSCCFLVMTYDDSLCVCLVQSFAFLYKRHSISGMKSNAVILKQHSLFWTWFISRVDGDSSNVDYGDLVSFCNLEMNVVYRDEGELKIYY